MQTTPDFQTRIAELLADLAQHRHVPVATYRLQFNAAFTFVQAAQLVPYLQALGISDCYASPYLKARPGSTHGYDTIDFQALNPEIGTETEHTVFVQTLQRHGMGQILDIVPNHMGVLACHNTWWQDVLEHGPASVYASFFDIDWQPPRPALKNKVLLPILGDAYGTVLDNQELQVAYACGRFELHYYEHHLPIAPCTTRVLLQPCLEELQQQLGEGSPQTLELQCLLNALEQLPAYTDSAPERSAARYRQTADLKQRLAALYDTCETFHQALAGVLQSFNGVRDAPRSFDRLHTLLEAQPYRLSAWRAASDEINYRRFFDINDLAALCQEEPAVFDATHKLILDWLQDGKLTGVRVDHPDGLFDPLEYFRTLQRAYVQRYCQRLLALDPEPDHERLMSMLLTQFETVLRDRPRATEARPLYVVVEKILEAEEQLPGSWPVDGTTGYDFLNQLNGLFVDRHNAAILREIYTDFTGEDDPLADILYAAKKLMMQTSMSSELTALGVELDRLSETNRYWRDFTRNTLTDTLQEVIACFPVYRSYIRQDQEDLSIIDRTVIETAVAEARRRNPAMSPTVFAFLREVLLLQYPRESSQADRWAQLRFVQKFQQITAPVMAKGLEDTAFYRYTPLASLNEVGGDPDRFGLSLQAFHQHNLTRRQYWPATLLTTSTHDTKRSEDVRARLNVLSEVPQQWHDCLWQWHRLNQSHKTEVDGQMVPSRQEEYLLYQTLLGTYPLQPPTSEDLTDLCQRLQDYMRKALREAKVHTTWIDPHGDYEDAVERFVAAILDDTRSGAFLRQFRELHQRIADVGMWNALAQLLLKLTCPGVPDLYQGCELWNFSLVDPDNRRAVDYPLRRRLLSELQQRCQRSDADRLHLVQELLHSRRDGRLKLYVTWQTLTLRREQARVFLEGDYLPLAVTGDQQRHVCAFARVQGDDVVIVLVPRLVAGLLGSEHSMPLGASVWGETCVAMPETLAATAYRQRFTGATVYPQRAGAQVVLPLPTVFADFPMALLQRIDG